MLARRIVQYTLLFMVAIIMIFPVFWMIVLSLKENPEMYNGIWATLFSPYSFENFRKTLSSDAFGRYFLNSVFIGIVVTIGNIFFCFLCGYAFARKSFFGKKFWFATILAILIIPQQVVMIPLYRMMVEFEWINTYMALIIPFLITPFGVFLMRQFISTLPHDIEDAARIDGASEIYIITRIVFPLCKPIITVLGIYVMLSNWNSFLYPYLFSNDELHRTLPVGLAFYIGKQSINWGELMAGASISAMPVLLLFSVFQRQIIQGLTAGALKE